MLNVPGFRVFNAPHELLSEHDFKQASFQNSFALIENEVSYLALASQEGLTVIKFDGPKEQRPRLVGSSQACKLDSKMELPKDITLSFTSMEFDRFFSMLPFKSRLHLYNFFAARHGGHIIFGLPTPEQMSCIVTNCDELLPLHGLKPFDCLTCKSSSLGLDQVEYRYVG